MLSELINKIREYNKKIILVGEGGNGRTTLMQRYIYGKFNNTPMTIGVDFFTKKIKNEDKPLNIIFWDFAGQERWRFFQIDLYKGADGAILNFDLTRPMTLERIDEWVRLLRSWDRNLPIILLGMKNDLADYIMVDDEYALAFTEKFSLFDYIRVSCKSGENVNESFENLFYYIFNRRKNESIRRAIEIKLKKKFPKVEKLIQDKKFSDAETILEEINNIAKKYKFGKIIEWTLQKRCPIIEQLIQDEKYSMAESELEDLNNIAILYPEIRKWTLEKKFSIIELLIQNKKYLDAEPMLERIKKTVKDYHYEMSNWVKQKLDLCYKLKEKQTKKKIINNIKKTILDLGTKFGRLQIMEISEVCSIKEEELIIDTVKEMINNKEIYAQYFSSSKAVAFDQQANIEEIDRLMATYKKWEKEGISKK